MLMFFYILQFIIAFLLIVIVIFQKTEGGTGLISSNMYNSFFSSKAFSVNPLTKVTVILGFLLFINSLVIGGLVINKSKNTTSIADKIGEVLEQQKDKEQQKENKPLDVPVGSTAESSDK